MRCRIIQADGKEKVCKCGHNIFRKSTKSKYTNKEKTKGVTYSLNICDKCGHREEYNHIKWRVHK